MIAFGAIYIHGCHTTLGLSITVQAGGKFIKYLGATPKLQFLRLITYHDIRFQRSLNSDLT